MPSRNAGASRSSGRPGPEVQIAFDELLATGEADDGQDAEVAQNRPSVLDDLNAGAAMGLDSVVNELAKLERSGSPGLPADLFGEVSRKVVVRFSVPRLKPQAKRRFVEEFEKRTGMLDRPPARRVRYAEATIDFFQYTSGRRHAQAGAKHHRGGARPGQDD